MKYKLDLHAKVQPEKSAGGFPLGINIDEIDSSDLDLFNFEQIKDYYLPEYPPINKYITNIITLDFVENILAQIWINKGYNGKLECGLGLRDYIGDFEKIYGKVVERFENHYEFSNLNGLFFILKTDNYKVFKQKEIISDLLMDELCVHK